MAMATMPKKKILTVITVSGVTPKAPHTIPYAVPCSMLNTRNRVGSNELAMSKTYKVEGVT